MERTGDAILLALFALPDPPDCRLVDTGVSAAAEEQGEGAAARGAVGADPSSGRRGSVEAAAPLARVNPGHSTTPVGRREGGGAGRHVERFMGDEAARRRGVKGDGGARHLNATLMGKEDSGARHLNAILMGKEDSGASGTGPERSVRSVGKQWGSGASGASLKPSAMDVAACGQDVEEEFGCGCERRHPTALMTPSSISSVSDGNGCLCSRHAEEQPPCGGPTPGHAQGNCGLSENNSYHYSINRDGCAYGTTKTTWPTSCGEEKSARIAVPVVADLAGAEACPSTSTATFMQASAVYDPSYEILLCNGKVLSKCWRVIWERSPLVLHDKNLIRCYPLHHELRDLTEVISNILDNHPGSAQYFRLDSTKWAGGRTQLSKWLKRLSEKNVCEIIIVNLTYDTLLEFPLEDIGSSCLEGLRLGFFALSDLDLYCFDYGNLDTLDLVGCTFDTHRLYHVVKDCKKIKHLGIGLSVRDIKLHSESLEHLQIWRCRMRSFTVEFCPRLQRAVIGIRPKEECVSVTVQGTPCLQEFQYMLLPVNRTEDPCWMSTLKKVCLGIQFDNCSQRKLICDYLKCTLTLQELTIWRMDDVGLSEELDTAVDDSLLGLSREMSCSRTLIKLEIQDFRGGCAEIAVARAVLKQAVSLRKLKIVIFPLASKEKIGHAFKALQRMERASTNCSFVRFRPSS